MHQKSQHQSQPFSTFAQLDTLMPAQFLCIRVIIPTESTGGHTPLSASNLAGNYSKMTQATTHKNIPCGVGIQSGG